MRVLCSLFRKALAPSAALFLALGSLSLPAQVSNVAPRIRGPIDESALVPLKGNVTALARPQFDRGEADPAVQLTGVRLVLSRSAAQEAALEQFMAEQLDKTSPNYHHWLTPQQFGQLYGPADSDMAALEAWLESHGLSVENVSPGRTNIAFSGSVRQMEEAFHTTIHSFNAQGRQFYSNTGNPQIPAALAGVVRGVAHLNTLEPRSYAIRGNPATYDAAAKRLTPLHAEDGGARAGLTYGSGSSEFLYMVAGDAATIYDTPNSLNANFSSGTSYTGQGVTIGIGGDGLIQASTVENYRKLFIGDSAAPNIINVLGTASANGDTDEAYLDTEISGALAPGATIDVYVSSNLDDAIEKALSDNTVDIFSLSFGECEMDLTTADNQLIEGWWQQAASQGIAVTVSTGDSGSAGCDDNDTEQTAAAGLQVSGFASTPYNIAVGGTDTYGLLNGASSYVSSTNSSLYRSALKYIPESTWNDSVVTDGLITNNEPEVGFSQTGQTDIIAGAGGASSCSTNTDTSNPTSGVTVGTCTHGYAKPSWQRGTGVPSDGVRDVPDVSLMAGNGYDDATWLVCTDDTNNGTAENCTLSGGTFSAAGFGGTSASAPAFAGILALVQQKVGGRLGADGAKTLYDLFNGSHAASIFHDVTQGNNSVPCTQGTPNCSKDAAGSYFLSGYNTTAGYDLATGMGSVDATQLVNDWGAATGSGSATVTPTLSSASITTAQSLTVNVTVTGSAGTPTGTVTLSGGGYTSSAVTLSAGAASFTVPAGSLAVGNDTLTVAYSGDTNYASTTGQATVTVTTVAAPATYALAATNPAAINSGGTATSTVTVSSSTGYAGSVSLACALATSPSGATDLPTCSVTGSPVTLSSSTTSGTATVTISTTAAQAQMQKPRMGGWLEAGSGMTLALLVFFGIPARRKSWRAMLGVFALLIAFGAFSACGGGGGSSGSGSSTGGSGGTGNSNPGTTAGTYTFTVTGTGNPAVSPAPTATITLTVN